MKNLTPLLLFLVLLVSCTATKESNKEITKSAKGLQLEFNMEKGQNFLYRHTQTQDIEVAVMGMNDKSFQNQVTEYLYEITDKAANGLTDLDLTIQDISITQKSSQANMEFDSKNKGDVDLSNPQLKMYHAMLGQKMKMGIMPNGKIVSFSGADEMYDKIFSNEDMSAMGDVMRDAMKKQFGDEAMKDGMKALTNFYPDKPIKVGKSWNSIDTAFSNLGLITDNTYTLTKRENGIAYISVASKITSNPAAEGLDMGMIKIKYNLTGTQTGIIEVNEKTGWANTSNLKQIMEGDMLMIGAAVGGEMNADVKMNSVYTYSTVEE